MKYSEVARLYKVWWSIRDRCHREGNPQYKNYGGRGIFLSKEWHDFDIFIKDIIEDIGDKPEGDYELDRIDNDKGYQKGNIRWATVIENQRNKRNNTYYLTHLGKICKSELIEKLKFTRKQFDRYVEYNGIDDLLERFKNNDIPQKHVYDNPEKILGKKLGSLTFVSLDRKKGGYSYSVKCECGFVFSINRVSLIGRRKRMYFSCKKCKNEETNYPNFFGKQRRRPRNSPLTPNYGCEPALRDIR